MYDTFDPNAGLNYAGYQWQFDTPQAYTDAANAAANSENGRFDYNLGLGSGWNDSMLRAIGYTGPSPFEADYTNSTASENGQLESNAAGQAQLGGQALKSYLDSKGYALGTSYGKAGPGGFWFSGGSPKIQHLFDSTGKPVGGTAIAGGYDTMFDAIKPILMALTAGMGGEIAGAAGDAAGGASAGAAGGAATDAMGGAAGTLGAADSAGSLAADVGSFNPYGFTGQGFGQIPIQSTTLGASMGNIANIGRTVIGGAKSRGVSGGGNYVNSLSDGSMYDDYGFGDSLGVGDYGVFNDTSMGTYQNPFDNGGTPNWSGNNETPFGSFDLGQYGGSDAASGIDWAKLAENKNLMNLIGGLGSAGLTAYGANKAANAQVSASNAGNQLLWNMYQQNRADNMPALVTRNAGLQGYSSLLANPSSITSDPGYKFGLDQGTRSINSQAAARGGLYSGSTLKALDKFGQDYGQSKFDTALNRYGNEAGLGQVGSSQIGSAGMNYGNNASGNMLSAGNARGASTLAGYGAFGNALNNYMGYQNTMDFLDKIKAGG